jgi:protoporphyrin/coproporphyrin ferrochelatase
VEKTAIVLINLGTPEAPTRKSVKRFLSEFLNDPFVIDLPYIARKILVNCIIIPFRAGKSTNMYKKIWTEKGSPIMIHSKALLARIKQEENAHQTFYFAMRYGNPSISQIFSLIQTRNYDKIIVIPLFPQYASSTTESVIKKCKKITTQWHNIPQIKYIDFFYNHPAFTDVWVKRLNLVNYKEFDHILFVFHGIPLRQAEKSHQGHTCEEVRCKTQISNTNNMCYQAQCYNNARILGNSLNLKESDYSVCFQSRFGKDWLNPFADKIIIEKANSGIKSLLVVPLSFVADCLETKLEIELEYAELFKSLGGESLTMLESLNSGDDWTDALLKIINYRNSESRIT